MPSRLRLEILKPKTQRTYWHEKRQRSPKEYRRIPRDRPGTRARHLEEDPRGDSVGCAAGGHGNHQLWDACVQTQWSARMVRRRHPIAEGRSEEHTSELQSLAYLVCR